MSQHMMEKTNATSNVRVLVIGKLGELVKKIYELEYIIARRPNAVAAVELASYNLVLAAWPVDNVEDTHLSIANFKLQLDKFHSLEKEFALAVASKNELRVTAISAEYLTALDVVKATMKHINALGKHIGDSIWLEIKP